MRNLILFIQRYSAFFLFVIFEIISLVIYIKYNSFQKATFLNSSNQVTGNLYEQVDKLKSYLSLTEVNDNLVKENARLRNQLLSSKYVDTVYKRKADDTVYHQQYEYLEAKVISNSVNHRNNYITINMGSKEGVEKGKGVISNQGVVGKVIDVTEHFAIVQSLLHKETIFSAMLINSKERGSFAWGDNMDPTKGLLFDVSNNATPKVGELVLTSDKSLFPAGIPIGHVSNLRPKSTKGSFLNMEVTLAVDFGKLDYVYVITNKFAQEQAGLEARQKKDE
jgi:rod shape-determining protein MreC